MFEYNFKAVTKMNCIKEKKLHPKCPDLKVLVFAKYTLAQPLHLIWKKLKSCQHLLAQVLKMLRIKLSKEWTQAHLQTVQFLMLAPDVKRTNLV